MKDQVVIGDIYLWFSLAFLFDLLNANIACHLASGKCRTLGTAGHKALIFINISIL